ncbi:DHH family phosphoesterase [Flavilitoribacter nigricans]|nr:bifunctional oligoribonuclease/PAP phosphatase NrnA [Flavilitoribacter nigricans]
MKRFMEFAEEIKKILSYPKDIAITTHRNPDGDAIGSSLGLYHYLNMLGHSVRIVVPSEYPDFMVWMPDVDRIIIYDIEPEESAEVFERAEVIFCLDFNSLDRIDKVGDLFADRRATKILIDHHLYPEHFADYTISNTEASSTCEMIFDFIEGLGDKPMINKNIGDCLFTGILTDTGSFKYATSAKLFRIVAQLLEVGVDDYMLQDLIFNSMTEKQLRLLGHCLHNRMEILEEFRTGIITLTKEDYANFDIKRGDTEGIVNYLLKMKKIVVAAFITEQPTIVKISLRSKGDFSVQEIARRHFKGGGHKNAAGGASFKGLRTTVKRFKELLPLYKDQLNS